MKFEPSKSSYFWAIKWNLQIKEETKKKNTRKRSKKKQQTNK